jgi:hypothetical protein
MPDSGGNTPKPALEPDAGREHQAQPAQRTQPSFGPEEAEVVADAQDQAVEQGGLPPSRDEAEPGSQE